MNSIEKIINTIQLGDCQELLPHILEKVDRDVLYKCEDYHILSMQAFCIIKDNKHIIQTIVDYVRNQKHYRKIFENVLDKVEEN